MQTPMHITQEAIDRLVKRLQDVGDRLEASGNPDWYPVALAAVFIAAQRHGITEVPPPSTPVFVGIDMGTGDRTVFGGRHHA